MKWIIYIYNILEISKYCAIQNYAKDYNNNVIHRFVNMGVYIEVCNKNY